MFVFLANEGAKEKEKHSWPKNVDHSAAVQDWNWKPNHDLETAMENYLVPGIKEFYNL